MTHASELVALYDYHYWANGKLLGVAAQLTPAQFTQDVAGSYGSIRNTMVHVLSAEWGWLDRSGGHPRGARLNAQDFPTIESLTAAWKPVEGWVREFLSGLKDADLSREVAFSFGGPTHRLDVGEMLTHAAIHAVHHRGQAALLLRMLGVAPGNFDFLEYRLEQQT